MTGHLWQDRFSSYAMDESHLMSAVRYVELNPCDAGLVDSPYDWAWSSARAHLHGQDDKLVKVAPMLDMVIDWDSYLNQRLDIEKVQAILKSMEAGNPGGEVGTV